MKVSVLCVALTISVVSAGFFTPSPEKRISKDDANVKEVHGDGVVIEFDEDKVSVSPKDRDTRNEYVTTNAKDKLSGKMEEAKERIKEAASSVLPDQARKQEANEAVSGKVTDTVSQATQTASGKAYETKESLKGAASGVSSKAKETVAGKASEMKQGATEQAEKAKETANRVKEEAERKVEGAKGKATEKAEELVGTAKDGERVTKEGQEGVKGVFRRGGDVFKYVMSPVTMLMSAFAGVLHLLGFAVAYGMCVWVTFASSYVLAGALPGLQFAMVQSKMYPVYLKAMASSVGMALFGFLLSGIRRPGMFGGYDLTASLAMILVNLFYLEPRTTKVMFERMKKEKEEGTGKEGQVSEPAADVTTETGNREEGSQEKREEAARPRIARSRGMLLRKMNPDSSLLNVITLMPLTWHLVHLAHNLHAAC